MAEPLTIEMALEEFQHPPVRDLPKAQERRLNRKYATGDFGGGVWSTVKALLDKGHVEASGNGLVITAKGFHYCHHHGPDMPI